jgi:streptomycin 6-kinase
VVDIPRGPRAASVDRLPALLREVIADWQLAPDGPARHGATSLVLPVRTTAGRPAVLKLGMPHDEAQHEHLALRTWGGHGAVQLLRADPRRRALLLERLHADEDLTSLWDLEACEVVAGCYSRLHVPAIPQLRRLSSHVGAWTDRLAALPSDAPVPRRLVEQAVSLGRAFVGDEATDARLIHGDLHYANVLAGEREPWLVIDPKPMAGDPHYEVAPMLWNRWPELAGDVRGGVRRRFHTIVDAALLDEDRARDWVVVRMLHNALWRLTEPTEDGSTADYLTMCVTVAKAVQD